MLNVEQAYNLGLEKMKWAGPVQVSSMADNGNEYVLTFEYIDGKPSQEFVFIDKKTGTVTQKNVFTVMIENESTDDWKSVEISHLKRVAS